MKSGHIKDVRIPCQVILGGCKLSLEELGSLNEGTILELNEYAGEALDLYAAGKLIAKGEAVVIDENFGLRITSMEE